MNPKLAELIANQDDKSIIDLSRQQLIDQDMIIISKRAVVRKKCIGLNLWGNNLTYKSISTLVETLNGNETLKELDLACNRILDKGIKIISPFLALNTCILEDIDLSSNGITEEGARHLAYMCRKNRTLKTLALNNNRINDTGLTLLVEAIVTENTTLKQLKLESNEYITTRGVLSIFDLLQKSSNLEELCIKNRRIKDDLQMLQEETIERRLDIIIR